MNMMRFTDESGKIIECNGARIVGIDESIIERKMICKGSRGDVQHAFSSAEMSFNSLIGALSAIQRRNFGDHEPDMDDEYALFGLLIGAAKDAEFHVDTLRKLVFGHNGNSPDPVVTASQVAAE